MKALLHLKKILIHKYWVFHYCCKFGIPWQGIVHDLSKFSPTEFIESVKYYQGDKSPIVACKAVNGYSMAWQHHKGRNPHHYEFWQDNFDTGATPIEMPYKYIVECLADYLGAARAYLGDKFTYKGELEWWNNKKKCCVMHVKSKEFITLALIYITLNNKLPNSKKLKDIYKEIHRWKT